MLLVQIVAGVGGRCCWGGGCWGGGAVGVVGLAALLLAWNVVGLVVFCVCELGICGCCGVCVDLSESARRAELLVCL